MARCAEKDDRHVHDAGNEREGGGYSRGNR
jgi:hypothetical protein